MTRNILSLLGLVALLPSAASAQFSFVEVTAELGLEFPLASSPGPGSAVADYNGDGWPDIILFGIDNSPPRIYRNNGALIQAGMAGRWFQDLSHALLPKDCPPSSMGMMIDVDNDGDPDMVFSRLWPDPITGEANETLCSFHWLENRVSEGEGFVDSPTNSRAMGADIDRASGFAAADCDVDGDLDVIFLHNGPNGTQAGGMGFYLRNEGGSFSDQSAIFGADITTPNRYFTPVLADFNGDLLPDLHVAIDFYRDFHCHNIGGGVFQDVSQAVGVNSTNADMGLAVGDPDNDGDLDMYSTNINIGVMYINDGTGNFSNQAGQRGVQSWGQQTLVGWGTAFADLDLDGDQDLAFVGYGQGVGRLYENDGTGYFTDQSMGSPTVQMSGHGLIPFDYDRDGDLDLFIVRKAMASMAMYENLAADGGKHWLQVSLVGDDSNSAGVGARIELTLDDGSQQTRHVMHGTSFRSALDTKVHFGLDDFDTVRRLVVRWPSGQVTELAGVEADRHLEIAE